MPNRIVREAILSSEKMSLLGWADEVFYRRLMSIVDDYGRTEANPQLLRSRCYPLQTDAVRTADISRWLAACQKAGMILGYVVQGKQYVEVLNFGQQQRSPSKYPGPPADASKCEQPPADAHLDVVVVVDVFDKETSKLTLATARPTADQSPTLAIVPSKTLAKPAIPDCPHLEVLALWAEVLPSFPQHDPERWRGSKADHLRVRWRENATAKSWQEKAQGLAYFRKLFGYVQSSRFLSGRAPVMPGKRPFVLELEWLVNPTNWDKVHEGKYHEESAA